MSNKLRDNTWNKVRQLGFAVNPNLPEITTEDYSLKRSSSESLERLLCVYVVVATACGFSIDKSREWIKQEGLERSLFPLERAYLKSGIGDTIALEEQINSMWALAWSLQIHNELEMENEVPETFVAMLPDLRKFETSKNMRTKYKLRNENELIGMFDYAYCLHWAYRQAMLDGEDKPLGITEDVIRERRRAFEWLFTEEDWYEISLDT